jgi:protein gp37
MPSKTSIEWTDYSWNPIRARNRETGKVGFHCEHASEGCMAADNAVGCYAEVWNFKRKLGTGLPFTRQSRDLVEIEINEKVLQEPMPRRPAKIFVCDMTDLFAEFVRTEWIDRIMDRVSERYWITLQFLTKRPERMRDYLNHGPLYSNIWAGTSVESRRELHRLDDLRRTRAGVRFISVEPLFENLGKIDLTRIDWVIVGAQSGAHSRPMELDWVRSIRDQCTAAGVAFFFKQDAVNGKKRPLPVLDGRVWREFPVPKRAA